jgi:hypothetical protein
MYSKISPPGIHEDFEVAEIVHVTDHGAVYAPGSSIVAW